MSLSAEFVVAPILLLVLPAASAPPAPVLSLAAGFRLYSKIRLGCFSPTTPLLSDEGVGADCEDEEELEGVLEKEASTPEGDDELLLLLDSKDLRFGGLGGVWKMPDFPFLREFFPFRPFPASMRGIV